MSMWFASVMSTVMMMQVPGGDTAQLIILVQQSAAQLEEIRRIVRASSSEASDLRRAVELAEKMAEGLDHALQPYKDSRQYQEAMQKIQEADDFAITHFTPDNARDYMELYRKRLPEEAKRNDADYEAFKTFQKEVVKANGADLKDIEKLEERITNAPPGEIARLHTLASSKNWESNLRISVQLTELVKEIRALREEISAESIKNKVESAEEERLIRQAVKNAMRPADTNDPSIRNK